MSEHRIVLDHKQNFETLSEAFENGDVCLMDCIEMATGEHVAVICTVVRDGDEYEFVPFAKFFNGNPFELLSSPMEYDEEVLDAQNN